LILTGFSYAEFLFLILQVRHAKKIAAKIYPAVVRKDFFLHPMGEVFKV